MSIEKSTMKHTAKWVHYNGGGCDACMATVWEEPMLCFIPTNGIDERPAPTVHLCQPCVARIARAATNKNRNWRVGIGLDKKVRP